MVLGTVKVMPVARWLPKEKQIIKARSFNQASNAFYAFLFNKNNR